MDPAAIFGLQLILSLVVYALIAKWYAMPWLAPKPTHEALIPLILPHTLRHIGLTFLVPGTMAAPAPSVFAGPAAYGDLASALLALVAVVALRGRWSLAIPLVWTFNLVGTLDLLNALRQADVIPTFGATWYIPTFLVPLLLVTHAAIFYRLVAQWLPKTSTAT